MTLTIDKILFWIELFLADPVLPYITGGSALLLIIILVVTGWEDKRPETATAEVAPALESATDEAGDTVEAAVAEAEVTQKGLPEVDALDEVPETGPEVEIALVTKAPPTVLPPPETTPPAPVVTTPEPEPEPEAAPAPIPEIEKSISLFARLKQGLSKTRRRISDEISAMLPGGGKVDDAILVELEELLITSDVGVQTAMEVIEQISRKAATIESADGLKQVLKSHILAEFDGSRPAVAVVPDGGETPYVIMVVGVNGVGKTTTIGKLAARLRSEGKSVLFAAADTFRAAAIEQLQVWAERAGADMVKHRHGSDPAAVAFDAVEAAMARGADVVIVDTAGRLHTKVNLMEELKKIQRAVAKKMPGAPHEVMLVLDATTGQNALQQAKLFNEALGLTGLTLTKLDGTAKGGIVVAICKELNVPLRFIGVGEQIDDLQPFDPRKFVEALF